MVRTVSVPTPKPAQAPQEIILEVEASPPPAHHRVHSLSCLFALTALFLLFFLLLRALRVCCLACCTGGAVPRRVVLVPPEHAVIRTIAPHPMLAVEPAHAKAVQVAEPLSKA